MSECRVGSDIPCHNVIVMSKRHEYMQAAPWINHQATTSNFKEKAYGGIPWDHPCVIIKSSSQKNRIQTPRVISSSIRHHKRIAFRTDLSLANALFRKSSFKCVTFNLWVSTSSNQSCGCIRTIQIWAESSLRALLLRHNIQCQSFNRIRGNVRLYVHHEESKQNTNCVPHLPSASCGKAQCWIFRCLEMTWLIPSVPRVWNRGVDYLEPFRSRTSPLQCFLPESTTLKTFIP